MRIHSAMFKLWLLLYLWLFTTSPSTAQPGITDKQVVEGIESAERAREEQLVGYKVTEEYTMTRDASRHPAGQMVVDVVYRKDHGKEYTVRSQAGSSAVKLTFNKILERQKELSHEPMRHEVLISSTNYQMNVPDPKMVEVNGVQCRRVMIKPKQAKPFLVDGNIWVDANFHLVRVNGIVSSSLSMLTGRPFVERDYQDVQGFALATHYKSVSHTPLLGETTVEVQYRGYHDIEVATLTGMR